MLTLFTLFFTSANEPFVYISPDLDGLEMNFWSGVYFSWCKYYKFTKFYFANCKRDNINKHKQWLKMLKIVLLTASFKLGYLMRAITRLFDFITQLARAEKEKEIKLHKYFLSKMKCQCCIRSQLNCIHDTQIVFYTW